MLMTRRDTLAASAAATIAAIRGEPAAASPAALDGKVAVLDEISKLVHAHFYNPNRLPDFDNAVRGYLQKTGSDWTLADAANTCLRALKASHTQYFADDELDYYELLDIFQPALKASGLEPRLIGLFPPDGMPKYDGIGIAAQRGSDGWFVSDVYDSSPAAQAGMKTGDLILDVDGSPFHPIRSFRNKQVTARLGVVRSKNGAPQTITVRVETIRPNVLMDQAIKASVKTFQVGSHTMGILHLWTYATPDTQDIVQDLLGSDPLSSADGLILDMRSRHGGAPPDAAEMFLGRSPELDMIGAKGKMVTNFRYRKPLVGIIDGGTRSGMEILAFSLKRAGVPLLGSRTAGAVLGGQPFLLQNNALLYLAVMSATVDGITLEGVGVTPTMPVAYEKPFSMGRDPQLEAAKDEMVRIL